MSHGKNCSIETNSIHGGFYEPQQCYGSVKMPVFLTSTFEFKNCKDGEDFFAGKKHGYIYSRVTSPNVLDYEQKIAKIDGNEDASLFASGMSAVSTTFLSLVKKHQSVVYFAPVYGGTFEFFSHFLPNLGIHTEGIQINDNSYKELEKITLKKDGKVNINNVKVIYFETPTNPNLDFVDIKEVCRIRDLINKNRPKDDQCIVIVDNTFFGPIFQKPSEFGVDLTLYSATKFLGGHSDLIGGVVTGKKTIIDQIKATRMVLGSVATPMTAFLLSRSLETIGVRMEKQEKNCIKFFDFLKQYKKDNPNVIDKVLYPLNFDKNSNQYKIWKQQNKGPGSMISIFLKNKEIATKFIDSLKFITLAVSLGSTESLVQHPFSMTHSGVDPELKKRYNISGGLVRFSIGLENVEDLIQDVKKGLDLIKNE